jgi:hypothetical protein
VPLTFKNLQDDVLGWIDEGDNTTAPEITLSRVKSALNAANQKRASARRWRFMAATPLTLTLVPGTRTYALDSTVAIPIYFWNDSTNRPLTELNPELVHSRNYSGGGGSETLASLYGGESQDGDYVLGHQSITLVWTPATADVISYGFYRLPAVMTLDADLPDIPFPHSQILVNDALIKMATYNEDLGAKVPIWVEERDDLQAAFDMAFGQENSQFAIPRYVHYIP